MPHKQQREVPAHGRCFTNLLAADIQASEHDIIIDDHISYIAWVHVTVYSQIFKNSYAQKLLRGFKFTLTFKTALKPIY